MPPQPPKGPPLAAITPVAHYGYSRLCYALVATTGGRYVHLTYVTPDKVVEFQMSPEESIAHAEHIIRLAKQLMEAGGG